MLCLQLFGFPNPLFYLCMFYFFFFLITVELDLIYIQLSSQCPTTLIFQVVLKCICCFSCACYPGYQLCCLALDLLPGEYAQRMMGSSHLRNT